MDALPSSLKGGRARRAAAVCLALALVAAVSGCASGDGTKTAAVATGFQASFDRLSSAAGNLVTVAGAGDVNFGDGVTPYITRNGPDYPWPDAKEVFSTADLAFVNLECCISSGGSPVAGKEFTFRGPPDSAQGLEWAGVDVVSLANNHSKDWGTQAFLETLAHLKENDVAWCGAGNNAAEAYSPTVLQTGGKKVAFVAFTWVVPDGWPATANSPGCAVTWDKQKVADAVKKAKASADYVVASFHWGIELATSPNGDQRALAHLAVDNGADVVFGHHPHVVQGFELYKNRLIAYSLGNFIFSPPREVSSRTMAVVAMLGPKGLVRARVVPMFIRGCRPVIINGEAADGWMGTVKGYSAGLGTEMTVAGGRGFIRGSPAQTSPPGTGK